MSIINEKSLRILNKVTPSFLWPYARLIYRKTLALFRSSAYEGLYTRRKGSPGIYLIATPYHGNMGDHAIAAAELEFFRSISDREVYELPGQSYLEHEKKFRKHANPEDIILFSGGGSMGVEWFEVETLYRRVIAAFPHNKVAVLSQTIYYGESPKGKKELARAEVIYSKHKDLHLFAREEESFLMMKAVFPDNHVYLAPDFALLLERNAALPLRREGVLLCLRGDKEKALTSADRELIYQAASSIDDNVTFIDTVYKDVRIPPDRRDRMLEEKLREFQNARLVVTDRLHGMVFSAVTGTPCIVFGNYNHKVRGVYQWIRDLGYIRYLESPANISAVMEELIEAGSGRYDASALRAQFEEMAAVLL